MSNNSPIGVFDSGIGGLSVVRHIRARLPAEDLLYFADTAHAPYGGRPAEQITGRVLRIGEWLTARGSKALVLACNTATAVAVDALRAAVPVPVVAMEPALKPAARLTRSAVIGVLATRGTLSIARYAALRDRHGHALQVHERVCQHWVEQVESGDLTGPAARALVAAELQPLLAAGADTLVLGCTHFPFLAPLIQSVAGPDVAVVDPSPAVAEQLARRLAQCALLAPARQGKLRLFSSAPQQIRPHAVAGMLQGTHSWDPAEI